MQKRKKEKPNIEYCEAYDKSVYVLRECVHDIGMMASGKTRGYPHIWARDSMITLLGGILTGDKKILKALKSSIDVLRKNQSKLGLIPNNVHVGTKKVSFQAYADSGLWFIIGVSAIYKQTKDLKFLKKNYSAIKKTLKWYTYQNTDQSGLISMSEGSDWEDLFATRGKGLYVNILYYLALKNASFLAKTLKKKNESDSYIKRSKDLKKLINEHFWYKGNGNILNHIKFIHGIESFNKEGIDSLGRKTLFPKKTIFKNSSYYLPYLTFRDFGEWFDSFGNLLAIISGVADEKQTKSILNFIKKYNLIRPFPIKAICPPIKQGDKDWKYYYKFSNLNLPNQYHNGGIWPFLGGFYVAALVKEKKYTEAKTTLKQLALLNKKGIKSEWEFNEWFHGKTGKPMGMSAQAWSAGMYAYAYESVKKKKTLFF